MPRIQLKLMVGLATVVALTVLTSGYLAERGLHRSALADLDHSLVQRATLVLTLLDDLPLEHSHSAELTELAGRASRAAEARVTLMAPDGTVVADSGVRAEDLDRVENHASRPEVQAALRGEAGSGTRTSETVGRPLLYVAIPAGSPPRGAVRLAVELPDVEAAAGRLRRELLAAGAIGLVAALGLSLLFTWISLRAFRELREVLQALAGGDLAQRLRWRMRDERRDIAQSVNAMASQLEQRVAELTAEKEQLRAVLEGMVDGVLMVGADGRLVLVNRGLRELLGVWGDVEGRLPLEVIRNADIDALLSEASRSTAPILRDVELEPEGERVAEIHAVPLGDEERATGVVAVFHDTTALRRLEAMRRDFVANASHELKTPITAIRGFAELLATQEIPEDERKKQAWIVHQNAERVAALIEDLLELSRIESGRLQLQLVEVDLRNVAQRLLSDLAPMFADRSIEAVLEESEAPTARADLGASEQVLRNLLDNAAKYTDPGGRVSVRVEPTGDFVRVEVQDTGIGIPEHQQARVFERFYRVDAARSRALGGTGLGLAIVKHLVQACGGEVSLRSEPASGSTFSVTFPRAR